MNWIFRFFLFFLKHSLTLHSLFCNKLVVPEENMMFDVPAVIDKCNIANMSHAMCIHRLLISNDPQLVHHKLYKNEVQSKRKKKRNKQITNFFFGSHLLTMIKLYITSLFFTEIFNVFKEENNKIHKKLIWNEF